MAVEVWWEPFLGREAAAIDFAAAADALQGMLPCSDGERQVLLVAASIAEGIPVDQREAAFRLDEAAAALAARAVLHAAGHRDLLTGRDAPPRAAGAAAGAARWQQAADPGGVDQPAR